jgi:catechol-2,3-dioxygenase
VNTASTETNPPGGSDALRLTGAVVFVRELVRSENFYRDLLELDVEITSTESVMLSTAGGDHLVLRAMARAPRVFGGIGVQYLVWTARDAEDLERCERALRERASLVSITVDHGVKVVEGRDPDGIPVIVVYPPGPGPGMTSLPSRVYTY